MRTCSPPEGLASGPLCFQCNYPLACHHQSEQALGHLLLDNLGVRARSPELVLDRPPHPDEVAVVVLGAVPGLELLPLGPDPVDVLGRAAELAAVLVYFAGPFGLPQLALQPGAELAQADYLPLPQEGKRLLVNGPALGDADQLGDLGHVQVVVLEPLGLGAAFEQSVEQRKTTTVQAVPLFVACVEEEEGPQLVAGALAQGLFEDAPAPLEGEARLGSQLHVLVQVYEPNVSGGRPGHVGHAPLVDCEGLLLLLALPQHFAVVESHDRGQGPAFLALFVGRTRSLEGPVVDLDIEVEAPEFVGLLEVSQVGVVVGVKLPREDEPAQGLAGVGSVPLAEQKFDQSQHHGLGVGGVAKLQPARLGKHLDPLLHRALLPHTLCEVDHHPAESARLALLGVDLLQGPLDDCEGGLEPSSPELEVEQGSPLAGGMRVGLDSQLRGDKRSLLDQVFQPGQPGLHLLQQLEVAEAQFGKDCLVAQRGDHFLLELGVRVEHNSELPRGLHLGQGVLKHLPRALELPVPHEALGQSHPKPGGLLCELDDEAAQHLLAVGQFELPLPVFRNYFHQLLGVIQSAPALLAHEPGVIDCGEQQLHQQGRLPPARPEAADGLVLAVWLELQIAQSHLFLGAGLRQGPCPLERALPDLFVLGQRQVAQGPVVGPSGLLHQVLSGQHLAVHQPDPRHFGQLSQTGLESAVQLRVLSGLGRPLQHEVAELAEVPDPELVTVGQQLEGPLEEHFSVYEGEVALGQEDGGPGADAVAGGVLFGELVGRDVEGGLEGAEDGGLVVGEGDVELVVLRVFGGGLLDGLLDSGVEELAHAGAGAVVLLLVDHAIDKAAGQIQYPMQFFQSGSLPYAAPEYPPPQPGSFEYSYQEAADSLSFQSAESHPVGYAEEQELIRQNSLRQKQSQEQVRKREIRQRAEQWLQDWQHERSCQLAARLEQRTQAADSGKQGWAKVACEIPGEEVACTKRMKEVLAANLT